jgi:MFS family permease
MYTAPNKRSLGATNGLSQMAVSISRAIGPALSTSLFSFSAQHNILWGYGVYLLMSILVLLALVLVNLLHRHLPGENDAET